MYVGTDGIRIRFAGCDTATDAGAVRNTWFTAGRGTRGTRGTAGTTGAGGNQSFDSFFADGADTEFLVSDIRTVQI